MFSSELQKLPLPYSDYYTTERFSSGKVSPLCHQRLCLPFYKGSEMLNCRLNNPLKIHLKSDGNLSITQ